MSFEREESDALVVVTLGSSKRFSLASSICRRTSSSILRRLGILVFFRGGLHRLISLSESLPGWEDTDLWRFWVSQSITAGHGVVRWIVLTLLVLGRRFIGWGPPIHGPSGHFRGREPPTLAWDSPEYVALPSALSIQWSSGRASLQGGVGWASLVAPCGAEDAEFSASN